MKLGPLYRRMRERFRAGGLDSAGLDARFLIADVLALTPGDVLLQEDRLVSEPDLDRLDQLAAARLSGVPIGRALGHREFYGLDFKLNGDTLEPRPDSELLVDTVLARTAPDAPFRFADIGTGTGALAISILAHRKNATCVATDVSENALACAAANADNLGVASRLLCVRADYTAGLASGFDWLVSNPPYIATDVIGDLDRGVRDHEPRCALDGGPDGLDAYRAILPQAQALLASTGRIAVEIGFDQAASVTEMLQQCGFFDVEIIADLGNRPRLAVAGMAQ
ncbi:MAG: peptide chain release factor N(5)-glutamine methyltransferase [Roseibium sp.]|nr:peptide chain release factor N(5)-glutamine methyltransferase [Roseibium sp.]